jgi:hypothetical protein
VAGLDMKQACMEDSRNIKEIIVNDIIPHEPGPLEQEDVYMEWAMLVSQSIIAGAGFGDNHQRNSDRSCV